MPSRYERQSRRYPGLARRAKRQARREVRPQRRAAQRQIGRLRRQAGTERQRISRQGGIAQQALGRKGQAGAADFRQAAQHMSGLDRRQALDMAQATAQYGQGMGNLARRASNLDVRDVNQALNQDVRSIRQQTPTVRATARDLLETSVMERREAAQKGQAESLAEREAAKTELDFLLSNTPASKIHDLHNPAERYGLAKEVAKAEGVGLTTARQLVENFYAQVGERIPDPNVSPNRPLRGFGEIQRLRRFNG